MADSKISNLNSHSDLINNDIFPVVDSTDLTQTKKTLWSNIKSVLKTYFDSLYAPVLGADDNYVTDAQLIVIGNTSGTNTGDGTYGIANTNYVKIDAADIADNDYAKFTASGLEGRSYSEVLSDIGAEPADATILKDADIGVTVAAKTHASQHIVGGADSVFPADPNADKYLMWDDDPGALVWSDAPAPEGTAVKSTGEAGGTKFLREDGDGTCSWQTVAGGTDEKVKYDAGDSTAGYVADKIVAGTGISVAEGTGANENKLVITNTVTDTDAKVKYNTDDTLAGFLADKTVAGTGITLAEGTGGDADKLKITNSAPDQTVVISAGTNITSVTGTYPNFTINAATQTTDISGKMDKIADPNANRLYGWDDTDNDYKFIAIGTNLAYDHATHTLSATAGGTGDVVGPASAVDSNFAAFDTTTGKLLKDSGKKATDFMAAGSVTQYTDEMAQDAVGNAVGNGLDYDDATGAISVDETELTHNSLGSKQGGTTGEYYHLTSAQATVVANTSGTNTGDQDLSGLVTKATYDANTILKADTDNTPAALTVTEQTLVGRLTGGNISAVTIGIADNNIVQIDQNGVADNDFAKFTANGLEGRSYTEVKQDLDLEIGTDVAAQTHASQHAVGGADSVFPADPGSDKFLKWDDDPGQLVWADASAGSIEGTAILSTGEAGGTKFLREDGDGTCSWQTVAGGTDEKVKYDVGDPTAGYVADKFAAGTGISIAEGTGATENKLVITNTAPAVIDGSGTTNEIPYWVDSNTLGTLATATYPSLTELSYVKGVTSAIQTQLNAKGVGDMTLAGIQSVTGAKTFDKDKILMKGTSTGVTTISTANTSATSYTQTLQARDGTVANLDNVTYIGTTSVALNRSSAALTLAGITLTTPDIGTPSAGTLTNCTGLPVTGITDDTTSALGIGTLELGHASDTTISRVSAGVIAVEGVNVLTTAGGTLTGNITLGENTSIDLDPAGSADGKYTGICITGTAGAALAFGDLIYLATSDSRWEKVDVDATSTAYNLTGMCVLAAAGDGSATKILLMGQIRADAKFPTLTVGAPVYAGETAGEIQVAIPTGADNVIRVVGYALTANEIYFNPSQDVQTTVA